MVYSIHKDNSYLPKSRRKLQIKVFLTKQSALFSPDYFSNRLFFMKKRPILLLVAFKTCFKGKQSSFLHKKEIFVPFQAILHTAA